MHNAYCKKCGAKVSDQYSHCTVCQAPLGVAKRLFDTNKNKSIREPTGEARKSSKQRFKDAAATKRRVKIPRIYWTAIIASVGASIPIRIYLQYFGSISDAIRELVSWLLFLSTYFVILIGYTLITGKEVKFGNRKYSISRNVGGLVLGVLFAVLGFLLGGQNGVIIGVLTFAVIWAAIGYLYKNTRKKR